MSNFYGSATAFKTYHTGRGRTVPVGWSDANIEVALLVASEWLDSAYDQLWFGYAKDGFTQVRKWPRTGAQTNTDPIYVFEDTITPDQIAYATYEAAFRELTTTGSLTLDYSPQKYKSASVSGAVSVEYIVPNDASDLQLQIPVIGDLMKPLIDPRRGISGSLSGSLVRV